MIEKANKKMHVTGRERAVFEDLHFSTFLVHWPLS
jgi:hypothetical protein